jgi:hypothetical protein
MNHFFVGRPALVDHRPDLFSVFLLSRCILFVGQGPFIYSIMALQPHLLFRSPRLYLFFAAWTQQVSSHPLAVNPQELASLSFHLLDFFLCISSKLLKSLDRRVMAFRLLF